MPQAKREFIEIMEWLDEFDASQPGATPGKRLADLRQAFPSIRSQVEAAGLVDIWNLK
jgi:hypothetical protein